MKKLKFDHTNAKSIVSGDRTVTYRFKDDKDIAVGDRVEVVDKVEVDEPAKWEIPGYVEVIGIEELPLKDVELEKFGADKGMVSKENMIKLFQRYYGEGISDKSSIKEIHFTFDHSSTDAFLIRLVRRRLTSSRSSSCE